jgi:hypothetical protein
MEPLGSPKLDDPTAQLEKAVNTAYDRLEGIVEKVIPEVVNRPFGSQKVPKEQLLLEYNAAVRGNAQGYTQKLKEFAAQEGEQRGLQLFIEYVEEMER